VLASPAHLDAREDTAVFRGGQATVWPTAAERCARGLRRVSARSARCGRAAQPSWICSCARRPPIADPPGGAGGIEPMASPAPTRADSRVEAMHLGFRGHVTFRSGPDPGCQRICTCRTAREQMDALSSGTARAQRQACLQVAGVTKQNPGERTRPRVENSGNPAWGQVLILRLLQLPAT